MRSNAFACSDSPHLVRHVHHVIGKKELFIILIILSDFEKFEIQILECNPDILSLSMFAF